MIRIQRTHPGPAKLLKNGGRQTERDCASFDANPSEYLNGDKRFRRKSYYSWKVVKDALMRMHRGKCCYCEKRLEPADLHVEHFRPIGAFCQTATGSYEYPGYYWLAYSWDNLLLACPTCNGKKSATFPLKNPQERARSHHGEIANEVPMFIDPASDDPREHIRFKDDAPESPTERGKFTINELKLDNRPDLNDIRLKHFSTHRSFKSILEYFQDNDPVDGEQVRIQQDAARKLWKAMQENSQFSSMIVDLFEPTDPLLGYIEQSGD